jgi:hypothetical protein
VKTDNLKFHENLLCISEVVSCGQMDRHDDANSSFSLCFANAVRSGTMTLGNCFSFHV